MVEPEAVLEPPEDFHKEEALTLFKNITESVTEVTSAANSLMERIRKGDLDTTMGLSLLDVKNQLLAQYIINLTDIVIRKVSGKSIEGSGTVDRLVKLRVILERMKPIVQKLKYQIDSLLKQSLTGISNENDPSHFKANPANMMPKIEEDSEEEDSNDEEGKTAEERKAKHAGVYVPPKLAAVHYDGDENENAKRQRLLDRARRYALNSSVMQELKEEYLDTPVEVSLTNTAKQKEDKYQRYKREYEENYFTRLPVTKEERRRAKRLSTLGTLGDELTHFEDISVLEGKSDVQKKRGSRKRKLGGKVKGHKKKKKFH